MENLAKVAATLLMAKPEFFWFSTAHLAATALYFKFQPNSFVVNVLLIGKELP
jgi:hypothetical protein